jgi:NAD(P)-dependent dehydrogenase (short-subunit alcohol dehydrogenase family)
MLSLTLDDLRGMTDKLFDLSGIIALVIGGTGVLGGALAEALAAAGAAVAIAGRNEERGNARCVRIRSTGATAEFFKADASSRESLSLLRRKVTSKLGTATVLVNAAGGNDPRATVTPENPFEAISSESWSSCFELNVTGGILFPCQEFGPAMCAAGKGSIINIASVAGHLPLSRVAAYSAAKAAALNLTKFLAREWGRYGVRVNSITPGFFPAVQNRRLLFQEDGSFTPRGITILDHTPIGRFGEAQELAGTVVFLASEAASGFVTGADIRVDGGFLSQTI